MPSSPSNQAFTEEGRRNTRQRGAVRDSLDALDHFASAQQVYDAIRERGDKVGLSTVYRTLQAMADVGEVDALQSDGETLYRKCGDVHHHHLVCRDCGRTVEVGGPTIERWAEAVGKDHGFADVTHTIELFGQCPDCAKR